MSPGHSSLPLTILFITFLLLPSFTAYCPEKYSYQVCHQLYHLFEQGLLASPQNLYKIREEYFPSSRASPVYGHVGYNISYKYSASFSYNATRSCDGNNKSPLVPMKHSKCIPWSSSAILAYIDPMYLNSFQINLLDRLFQNAGAVAANLSDCANQYHQMSSMHVHLQLMLRLQEELPCIPSVEQASAVLEDLTSWLKAYAVSRSNQTVVQYSSYKGFSNTEGTDNELQSVICAIYIVFALLMAVTMGYWAPLCYKYVVKKADNQKNQWYFFFWAASFVATVCNVAILVFEILHLSDVGLVYRFHIAKLVLEPSFCLLDLVLAICIIESGCSTQQQVPEPPNSTQQAPESSTSTQQPSESSTSMQQAPESLTSTQQAPESSTSTQQKPESPNSTPKALQVPKLAVILSSVLCCTFPCKKHINQETLVRILGLWSLMLFIHLLSLAVLPTVIWAFVLPLRIISLITSIGAILFCLTAAVGVFIYSISSISISSQPEQSGINKCCDICRVLCLVAIPPLFLVILVLGTVVYLRLVMTSIDTTSVAGIIASFIPTAVLTVIGWVVGGRVLVGGVGGEGVSQGTPHQSNSGGRLSNFIKHPLLAFRGTGTYHHLPQNSNPKPV